LQFYELPLKERLYIGMPCYECLGYPCMGIPFKNYNFKIRAFFRENKNSRAEMSRLFSV